MVVGGSERTFGNMNRSVPSVMPIMAAVKAAHAIANHELNIAARKNRRSGPFAAALAGAAGLTGAAGLGAGGAADTAVDAAVGGGAEAGMPVCGAGAGLGGVVDGSFGSAIWAVFAG